MRVWPALLVLINGWILFTTGSQSPSTNWSRYWCSKCLRCFGTWCGLSVKDNPKKCFLLELGVSVYAGSVSTCCCWKWRFWVGVFTVNEGCFISRSWLASALICIFSMWSTAVLILVLSFFIIKIMLSGAARQFNFNISTAMLTRPSALLVYNF